MPRSLVTGGAGFIGSYLCERLLQEGHSVVCMDNLSTGENDNVAHLQTKRFEFIPYDVTRHIDLEGPVDYVLHFASPASPEDYLRLPIPTLKVGALGTHNALGLALKKRATFFLASTSEVYGDPLVSPQSEAYWGNVNPVGPRGVYDEAKRYAEAMTMAYHRVHGLNTRIARIFNTYGPRMRFGDGRAVPTFMVQALRGEPLTVHGDGGQTRSFCYIADTVEGLFRLLMSDNQEPVNIGNPDEMTINDLARLILEITGSRSPLLYQSLPIDDPKVRRPDITRAEQLLHWKPETDLRNGLMKTAAWFRERLERSRVEGKIN
ncbi:MAG: SDR family oxidoreductase [Gemmatimonadota bacterium]|nr:MAG: SDR family oxidoreductase [Gemmatimonadota bacterium]